MLVFSFIVTEAILDLFKAWEEENISVMCLQSTR